MYLNENDIQTRMVVISRHILRAVQRTFDPVPVLQTDTLEGKVGPIADNNDLVWTL